MNVGTIIFILLVVVGYFIVIYNKLVSLRTGIDAALSEAYPDLKADTHFLKLQSELTNLEGSIQNARRYYNAIVRDYNAKIASSPDMIIANKFHFDRRDYFELDDTELEEVKQMLRVEI